MLYQEQKGALAIRLQMFWPHQQDHVHGRQMHHTQMLFNSHHPATFCLLFGFLCQSAQRGKMLWSQRYKYSHSWHSHVFSRINRLICICRCSTLRIEHITFCLICKEKQLTPGCTQSSFLSLASRWTWTKSLRLRMDRPQEAPPSPKQLDFGGRHLGSQPMSPSTSGPPSGS